MSQQATQNAMGPWFIRDEQFPFRPGCSYATLVRLIERNKIGPETILRGPTTNQFWQLASHTSCVAHLLGVCHQCGSAVKPTDKECPHCHIHFLYRSDRQALGLMPVHALADVERSAADADMVGRNSHLLELGHEHMMHGTDSGRPRRGPDVLPVAGVDFDNEEEDDQAWERVAGGSQDVPPPSDEVGSAWASTDQVSLDIGQAHDRGGKRAAWIVWVLPAVNILALCTVFAITLAVVWRSFSSMPLRTNAAQTVPLNRETDGDEWGANNTDGGEVGTPDAAEMATMLKPGEQEMETARQLSGSTRLDLLREAQRLLGVVQQAVQEAGGELPEDFDQVLQHVLSRIDEVTAEQDVESGADDTEDAGAYQDPSDPDDGGGGGGG